MYEVEFKIDRTGLDPSTVEALIPSSFDEQSCTNRTRPLPRHHLQIQHELILALQLVKVNQGFRALASQQYIFIDIAKTLILTKAFSVSLCSWSLNLTNTSHTNFSHIVVGSKDLKKSGPLI